MLRKLHSLTGVVPLGIFLLLHLSTNARALAGRQAFDDAVASRNSLPFLLPLELVFVALPLLFHAGYGLFLSFRGRPNVLTYPQAKNWGYLMQRVTGVATLLFVAAHLFQFRLQRVSGKLAEQDYYNELCASLSSTQAGVPWMALGYLLGLAACVFHFSNGLYGFCFSWGITRSRRATRISSALFGAVGVALFALGAAVVIYFATGSRLFFATSQSSLFNNAVTCQSELAKEPSEIEAAQLHGSTERHSAQ